MECNISKITWLDHVNLNLHNIYIKQYITFLTKYFLVEMVNLNNVLLSMIIWEDVQ